MPSTHNTQPGSEVQGEGDYKSDRRYRDSAGSFAKSGKVDKAARKAEPANAKEAEEMKKAEEAGVSHSKGEDPALQHAPPRKP